MFINDWWNRYVPVRKRPQKGMQGAQFKNAKKPKVATDDVHDLQRYVDLSKLIQDKDDKRKPVYPVPHRSSA